MRQALLAAVTLAGCNQVFGVDRTVLVDAAPDADLRPDRDRDMIADVEDPCIASDRDLVEDSDGDGIANATDPCPLSAGIADTDADGLDDNCDPFRTVPGDRTLCTMRFLSSELNAALWKPRPGEAEFAIASGYLIGFAQELPLVTSVIAQERIMPVTGTTTLHVVIAPLVKPFRMRVWISADLAPSTADVACELYGDDTTVSVTPVGASALSVQAGPPVAEDTGIHLIAKIQAGKSGINLLCAASYNDQTAYGVGSFDGALRQQGFAVLEGASVIQMAIVYHRDDQPSLL